MQTVKLFPPTTIELAESTVIQGDVRLAPASRPRQPRTTGAQSTEKPGCSGRGENTRCCTQQIYDLAYGHKLSNGRWKPLKRMKWKKPVSCKVSTSVLSGGFHSTLRLSRVSVALYYWLVNVHSCRFLHASPCIDLLSSATYIACVTCVTTT